MHVCRERTRRALCLYPCVYWLAVLCFLFVCARVVSCGDFVASCPQKLVFVLQPIENIANAANSQYHAHGSLRKEASGKRRQQSRCLDTPKHHGLVALHSWSGNRASH